MYGFYEWAHYLKGNDQVTEVLTDHQNVGGTVTRARRRGHIGEQMRVYTRW